ncbi:hypothetical protein VRU48_09680 [Pedobacter sp. KR3-3]|uniref:Holin n=1 Tax=Pedobacter albus TaxID=3113905 RepID=A0ABU7I7C6_9SPHI|nr:hypothetical protein [Pedobacter sp. KR3-3]MEE1945378.1 hypothetical protein [Pedobacter sp. KR3-3]
MYESILVVLAIVALLLPKILLHFIREPYSFYLKTAIGIALLAFAWIFETNAPLPPKFLLTLAVLYGCIENYKMFKRNKLSVPKERF